MLDVLLTNDDGIEAEGLQALREALLLVEGVRLTVIAPDGNRSAMARSITTRRPLWVQEVRFSDGSTGYATDGTPVDCVRLAQLGLVEGFRAQLVVSGINHGANLGDDITYSGTVAAALEGVVLGLPAIAVSQQSLGRSLDFRYEGGFDFGVAAGFIARLVERLEDLPLPGGTLLNVNVPACPPAGVEVTHLGKRIYRDELRVAPHENGPPGAAAAHGAGAVVAHGAGGAVAHGAGGAAAHGAGAEAEQGAGRRRYWIYGSDPGFHDEPGTDLAAVAAGRIAVTPVHFDLTDRPGVEALRRVDLRALLDNSDDPAVRS